MWAHEFDSTGHHIEIEAGDVLEISSKARCNHATDPCAHHFEAH